ncbi:MAG: family 16 glycosylhydrolase [Eubacteriales bacterium]
MKEYKVDKHESSLVPEGKDWQLVWSDEFDGTEIDRTKWANRTSMMGMEWPAWTKNGVELDGKGNLVFTLIEEDGRPVSAQLQTGFNFMDQPLVETRFGTDALQWTVGKLHENLYTKKFGYFECRCRLQQKPGWWSAFWVQSPIIGASLDPAVTGSEIDIMESFSPGNIAKHNVFTGGYGLDKKLLNVGGVQGLDTSVFHRFGMKWDETGYTFYVDGKEDGKIEEYVSHCPEFILISTEPIGYRKDGHKPTQEAIDAIGDTFVVDYIRVFD